LLILLQELRELIESHSCRLEFLPPYSPDYNPIEYSFSVIKRVLKKKSVFKGNETQEELANKVVEIAKSAVTKEIATNQFRHCKIFIE